MKQKINDLRGIIEMLEDGAALYRQLEKEAEEMKAAALREYDIVLVKHNNSPKEFAFYVPDELIPFVKKGQGVLCSTMHGLAYATTTTGVISGDGAYDVAIANGAYIPLKPIVGIDHPALAEGPRIRRAAKEDFIEKLASAFEKQ